MPEVVVALGTRGVAAAGIIRDMVAPASSRITVLAKACTMIGRSRVHSAEGRSRECEEDHRMLGDVLGHFLHAARGAGHDHVPGVTLVFVAA
jgi:hypothetical protein